MKILTAAFFNRDTKLIAQELLGTYLIRRIDGKELAIMITETEAYDGVNDKASHASKGKTKRTEVMFGHPGILYVYLCYGVHFMLNVVTREHAYPAAVLIRGGITQDGQIINGPGKITNYLKINKEVNLKKAKKESGLWFEDRGVKILARNIIKSPRIGVSYAGPLWSQKKWRFTIKTLPKDSFFTPLT